MRNVLLFLRKIWRAFFERCLTSATFLLDPVYMCTYIMCSISKRGFLKEIISDNFYYKTSIMFALRSEFLALENTSY